MMEKQQMEILTRSAIYRLLSLALLYPDQDRLHQLRPLIDASPGTDGLRAALQGCSLEELQAEHRRVFSLTISKECPPYETHYSPVHIFQQTQEMGDIGGFYRAFGLEVAEGAHERLDHISIELEFMHFISYKEAHALESDQAEGAEICRDAQRRFLVDHLGCWVPLFCKFLSRKAERGFYNELAAFLGTFLDGEAELLGVEPERMEEVDLLETARLASPEQCDACPALEEEKE